jgi:hypothetical protein
MLAIEFSLDVRYCVFLWSLELTPLQDARVHAQESAVRIEDKVDNVQRDIQVIIFMSNFTLRLI